MILKCVLYSFFTHCSKRQINWGQFIQSLHWFWWYQTCKLQYRTDTFSSFSQTALGFSTHSLVRLLEQPLPCCSAGIQDLAWSQLAAAPTCGAAGGWAQCRSKANGTLSYPRARGTAGLSLWLKATWVNLHSHRAGAAQAPRPVRTHHWHCAGSCSPDSPISYPGLEQCCMENHVLRQFATAETQAALSLDSYYCSL